MSIKYLKLLFIDSEKCFVTRRIVDIFGLDNEAHDQNLPHTSRWLSSQTSLFWPLETISIFILHIIRTFKVQRTIQVLSKSKLFAFQKFTQNTLVYLHLKLDSFQMLLVMPTCVVLIASFSFDGKSWHSIFGWFSYYNTTSSMW